jgi:hypothetical protein
VRKIKYGPKETKRTQLQLGGKAKKKKPRSAGNAGRDRPSNGNHTTRQGENPIKRKLRILGSGQKLGEEK